MFSLSGYFHIKTSVSDVTAMSLVYYSRDIGVKSLALYFVE